MKLNFFTILKKTKLADFFIFFANVHLDEDKIKKISINEFNYSLSYLNKINKYDQTLFKKREAIVKPQVLKYDLDIIVPVYNSEKFIIDCIKSILEQETSYKIRLILIDDGSNDNSIKYAKKILEQGNKEYMIISQENKGLAAARNKGLKYVNSKYLMFVDSDDLLGRNAINNLLSVAFKYNADCVQGQFINFKNNSVEKDFYDKKDTKIKNKINKLYGFAWGKIFKSSLWSEIDFPDGLRYEDTIIKFYIEQKINRCFFIDDVVYFYRKNKRGISFTSRGNLKAIDTVWALFYCFDMLKKNSINFKPDSYVDILYHIKLSTERTSYLNKDIKIAIFNIWRKIILEFNLSNIEILYKRASLIQKSILLNKFYMFEFYCL